MDKDEIIFFLIPSALIDEVRWKSRISDGSYAYVDSIKIIDDFTNLQLGIAQVIRLPYNTKVSELIEFLRLPLFFDENQGDTKYSFVLKRGQFLSQTHYKNKDEIDIHHRKTLADLGIIFEEVVILDKVVIENHYHESTPFFIEPIRFTEIDFLDLVTSKLPEQTSHLHMVLLYTDSDIDFAYFVRASYSDLHILSGKNFQVYVLENLAIENSFSEHLKFWRAALSIKFYYIWALLGWLRTKPYDKTQCYEIGKK